MLSLIYNYKINSSGSFKLFDRQQATNVFANKHAIVIGPTPPGTGVIAFANLLQFSKSTSPINFDLVSPFYSILILLMPTSIITAPCFIQLDFTKFGLPTAATIISLVLQISSIFFVFE